MNLPWDYDQWKTQFDEDTLQPCECPVCRCSDYDYIFRDKYDEVVGCDCCLRPVEWAVYAEEVKDGVA